MLRDRALRDRVRVTVRVRARAKVRVSVSVRVRVRFSKPNHVAHDRIEQVARERRVVRHLVR